MRPAQPWKKLTSTVGLITTRNAERINVMAAEWTYFVAREPPHVAVVINEKNWTGELIGQGSAFTVTLASSAQADLADFVGGFSGREIDKSTTSGLSFAAGTSAGVPWVTGGVTAFECVAVGELVLPHYRQVVGEVVEEHETIPAPEPLVKHDGMYHLGPPVERVAVVAAVGLLPDARTMRVCATGPVDGEPPFEIELATADGSSVALGGYPCDEYGDLFAEIEIPEHLDISGLSIRVSRPGLKSALVMLAEPGSSPALS